MITTGPTINTVSKRYYLAVGISVVSCILLLINIISVTVAVLITRHCYKYSGKSPSSSLKSVAIQDSIQGHKINEDIPMTENPAYGPTGSSQERDLVSVNEGDNTQRVYEDIPVTKNPAYDHPNSTHS